MKTTRNKVFSTLIATVFLFSLMSASLTTYADRDYDDDKYDRYERDHDDDDRYEKNEKYDDDDDRYEKDYERNERDERDSDRNERNERDSDRNERNERGSDRNEKNERGSDRNEKNETLNTKKLKYKNTINDKYSNVIDKIDNEKALLIIDKIDIALAGLTVDPLVNENKIALYSALKEILEEKTNNDLLDIDSLLQ
ncbi:MAG: hypothetical protein Q9M94_00965 [Candidatus Gracilibacteria bacterium]|nr:hypothetical protein [Candidatus Gracilibacteria bacterium]